MNWGKIRLDDVADFCLGKMLDKKKNKRDPLPYLANINVRWGIHVELEDLNTEAGKLAAIIEGNLEEVAV